MKSDRQAARAAFSNFLCELLLDGTRPDGIPGRPGRRWTTKEFASVAGVPYDTARSWRSGDRLPRDTSLAERALLGSGPQWDSLRRQLRKLHEAASLRPKLVRPHRPINSVALTGSMRHSNPIVTWARRRSRSALRRVAQCCTACRANHPALEVHCLVPIFHRVKPGGAGHTASARIISAPGGSPAAVKNLQLLCPSCHAAKHRGLMFSG